jgi:hypothetical protein
LADPPRSTARFAQRNDYSALGQQLDYFCIDTDCLGDFYLIPAATLVPKRPGGNGMYAVPNTRHYLGENFKNGDFNERIE